MTTIFVISLLDRKTIKGFLTKGQNTVLTVEGQVSALRLIKEIEGTRMTVTLLNVVCRAIRDRTDIYFRGTITNIL